MLLQWFICSEHYLKFGNKDFPIILKHTIAHLEPIKDIMQLVIKLLILKPKQERQVLIVKAKCILAIMVISLLIDIGIELLKLVTGVKVCMFGQLVIVLEVHKFTTIVIAKQKHYFKVAAIDSIIKLQ